MPAASAPSAAPALPAEAAIELADYKLGSFSSDLSDFLYAVRGVAGVVSSIEEYLQRKPEPEPEEPVDRAAVARIVVFASAIVADAERIGRQAAELLNVATNLHYDTPDRSTADRHYDLADEWHRLELERRTA